MSNESLPLHALTALALGWDNIHERTGGHWWGREPHGGLTITIPRYDTAWCSVGPQVERFKVSLDSPTQPDQPWSAYGADGSHGDGKTPCEAIAKLIVHLHQLGKLPK